jgi:hypothetical protein
MARKRVVKGTVEFALKDSPYVVVKPVKSMAGYVLVRMTGKDGRVRTARVKESTFKTSPKYAHLREDVKRYYRGYPAEEYRPVERESAMVPYDEEFAKGQVERPKEVAVSEKTKRWTKARKRVREEFPGAFESGAYKKMEEVAAAAKRKIEEEETKKRAEKAGVKISIKGIDRGDVSKVVLIIIVVTLILAFISWLSSIF